MKFKENYCPTQGTRGKSESLYSRFKKFFIACRYTLACFTKLSPYSSTVVFAVNHFFPTIFKVLRVREGVSFNVCIQSCVRQLRSVAQLCPTLCDSVDCSLPGPSVRGTFQARILE